MKEKPSYYAILNADVRYDKRLKANEKLMYAEITALCNKNGYCHASNNYFAELYNVSKETVSRWIGHLIDLGYISRSIEYAEGTNQIINRYIRLNQYPIDKKVKTPIDKKVKDNTTSINTTSNNREKDKPSRSRFQKPKFDEVYSYMTEEKSKEKSFAKKESEKFIDFYESNGWKVGKNKMVSWKHAVSNWIKRADEYKPQQSGFSKNRPKPKVDKNR